MPNRMSADKKIISSNAEINFNLQVPWDSAGGISGFVKQSSLFGLWSFKSDPQNKALWQEYATLQSLSTNKFNSYLLYQFPEVGPKLRYL